MYDYDATEPTHYRLKIGWQDDLGWGWWKSEKVDGSWQEIGSGPLDGNLPMGAKIEELLPLCPLADEFSVSDFEQNGAGNWSATVKN